MTNEPEFEQMPDEICDVLCKATGMSRENANEVGILAQKIRAYAIDNIVPGESISPAHIAMASISAKMAGEWLSELAVAEANLTPEQHVALDEAIAAHEAIRDEQVA